MNSRRLSVLWALTSVGAVLGVGLVAQAFASRPQTSISLPPTVLSASADSARAEDAIDIAVTESSTGAAETTVIVRVGQLGEKPFAITDLPTLTLPDGTRVAARGSTVAGNLLTLRFPGLETGINSASLNLAVARVDDPFAPSSPNTAPRPVKMPVLLERPAGDATKVVRSTEVAIGPGSVVIDAVVRDGSGVAVRGRFVGFTMEQRRSALLSTSSLQDDGGKSMELISYRAGFGPDDAEFALAFRGNASGGLTLDMRLAFLVEPSSAGAAAGRFDSAGEVRVTLE